ncbi:MAG: nucleotidyltransferase domain-containing protein [Candidatus Methanoperedens sp.]|nr:nucleotidyltransferase domain-containing protein [Candidatus Methanoperedens sp.]
MISQFQDEDETLQMFINSSKKVFGNNLKAIVLFGSRASGMARKYSDYDLLIIAEKLPSDWRKRDNLVLELDQHGISDILLYTENEMEDAINSVNPIMMNIFDHPIKILHGKSCIDRLFHLFSKNISGNILKLGTNTWKITGEINV